MKKVFSVEKFKKVCKETGYTEGAITAFCKIWANECDGLTKEEMNKLKYVSSDSWMIEVEEKKNDK